MRTFLFILLALAFGYILMDVVAADAYNTCVGNTNNSHDTCASSIW